MQGLTEGPRWQLEEDAVRRLLTGDEVTVRCGLELVDNAGVFQMDLTDDLRAGEVRHDNYARVHGSCKLSLLNGGLAWGRDRVRPYMELSDPWTTARFNLGVYVLTTPQLPAGEAPATYEVDGYDLLYLLDSSGPGDTYVAHAGDAYYGVVVDIIVQSGAATWVAIDGDLQNAPIPQSMVWALTEQPVSWLTIVNDLLASINYMPLWVNQDGVFRSGPYTAPSDRAEEWTFDTSDPLTNIVAEERRTSAEAFGVPNWWRFIRRNVTARPTEGAGLYTVTNQSEGLSSIDVVGRTIRKVVHLEAADQAALVALGDKIVAEDKQVIRTYDIKVDPFPLAGHHDVTLFKDGAVDVKCLTRSWTLPLDGSQGSWVLESV